MENKKYLKCPKCGSRSLNEINTTTCRFECEECHQRFTTKDYIEWAIRHFVVSRTIEDIYKLCKVDVENDFEETMIKTSKESLKKLESIVNSLPKPIELVKQDEKIGTDVDLSKFDKHDSRLDSNSKDKTSKTEGICKKCGGKVTITIYSEDEYHTRGEYDAECENGCEISGEDILESNNKNL